MVLSGEASRTTGQHVDAGRLQGSLRQDGLDASLLATILELETHGAALQAEAVESDVRVARLLFGGELDKSKVQPLFAALDDATERTEHLNEVDLLQRGVQVAHKQSVV